MATRPLPDPGPRPPRPGAVPGFGEGPPRGTGTGIANARVAVVFLLVGETMFFTGLIGAYLVLRVGASQWPPPGLPRLPLLVTALNTLNLAASGATFHLALRALRRDDRAGAARALGVTALLGTLFLAVQGSEWARLVAHGLTLRSGVYGATFYVLIGVHALHVVAAVAWLLLVWRRARAGRYAPRRALGVELCALYWDYVVGLWLALFALVYVY